MGLENYQPSKEEIANAEEQMSPLDRAQSGMREAHIENIREVGRKSGIEIDTEKLSMQEGMYGQRPEFHIEGMVQGHRLIARGFPGEPTPGKTFNYRIAIDGIKIDNPNLNKALFEKYFSGAWQILINASRREDNQVKTKEERMKDEETITRAEKIGWQILG